MRTELPRVECEFCGSSSKNKYTLKAHQKSAKKCLVKQAEMLSPEEIKFSEATCGKCEKKFARSYIKLHEAKCNGKIDPSFVKCCKCLVPKCPDTAFGVKTNGQKKTSCLECTRKLSCIHGVRKYNCKPCNGAGICEHGKQKAQCKICSGSVYCEHGKHQNRCIDCGGKGICEHGKYKDRCVACDGNSICEHKKRRNECSVCDPRGHLAQRIRTRIWASLKGEKTMHSVEYLGCTLEQLVEHLEVRFQPGMTWENYGPVWHVDHIVPLKFENPTLEDVVERLHYTHVQGRELVQR